MALALQKWTCPWLAVSRSQSKERHHYKQVFLKKPSNIASKQEISFDSPPFSQRLFPSLVSSFLCTLTAVNRFTGEGVTRTYMNDITRKLLTEYLERVERQFDMAMGHWTYCQKMHRKYPQWRGWIDDMNKWEVRVKKHRTKVLEIRSQIN